MQQAIALEDVGILQARYQALPLAARAKAVLADAAPALEIADKILAVLEGHAHLKNAFEKLSRNSMLIGKMRASEARNLLMEGGNEFIRGARHKLAAWRKTLERIASGEDVKDNHIPASAPVALAIIGSAGLSSFLSIIPLALSEIAKLDAAHAADYTTQTAHIRRCSTVLADFENAAAFQAAIR